VDEVPRVALIRTRAGSIAVRLRGGRAWPSDSAGHHNRRGGLQTIRLLGDASSETDWARPESVRPDVNVHGAPRRVDLPLDTSVRRKRAPPKPTRASRAALTLRVMSSEKQPLPDPKEPDQVCYARRHPDASVGTWPIM